MRTVATVLFHPDFNRRPRNHTESADPSLWRGRRSRAWVLSTFTAGGDFHPALRTSATRYRWPDRNYAQAAPCRQEPSAPGIRMSSMTSGQGGRSALPPPQADIDRRSGLGHSTHPSLRNLARPYSIFHHLAFGPSDAHYARLFGKLSVKIPRAGKTVPGFDTEKLRAGFRPNSEFLKSLPGHFDRWTVIGCIAHRTAREPVQNHCVVIEQTI